jgi:hypothetical protein
VRWPSPTARLIGASPPVEAPFSWPTANDLVAGARGGRAAMGTPPRLAADTWRPTRGARHLALDLGPDLGGFPAERFRWREHVCRLPETCGLRRTTQLRYPAAPAGAPEVMPARGLAGTVTPPPGGSIRKDGILKEGMSVASHWRVRRIDAGEGLRLRSFRLHALPMHQPRLALLWHVNRPTPKRSGINAQPRELLRSSA